MTEAIVVILSCIVAALCLVVVLLSASVPFMWWKCFEQQRTIRDLDDRVVRLDAALAEVMRTMGLDKEIPR